MYTKVNTAFFCGPQLYVSCKICKIRRPGLEKSFFTVFHDITHCCTVNLELVRNSLQGVTIPHGDGFYLFLALPRDVTCYTAPRFSIFRDLAIKNFFAQQILFDNN